jgi:hypothetical protein
VVDKKTGGSTTLELDSIGTKDKKDIGSKISATITKDVVKWTNVASDTDLQITATNTQVKLTRILKSIVAPLDAKFKITQTGKAPVVLTQASIPSDPTKKMVVSSSTSNGILSETIDFSKSSGLAYPLHIDPVISVGVASSTDDIAVLSAGTYYLNSGLELLYPYGSGMRFVGITIPSGATISSSYITLVGAATSVSVANSIIYGEQNNNALTYSDGANYIARTLTTASVLWNGVPQFVNGTSFHRTDAVVIILLI